MSTDLKAFEEKGKPKQIRIEVPLLTSLTPYREDKPADPCFVDSARVLVCVCVCVCVCVSARARAFVRACVVRRVLLMMMMS